MDNETTVIVTTPDPLGSGQPNENLSELEMGSEISGEVATVADEILVEVKECQARLITQTAALESLQGGGGPASKQEIQECLSEIKTLRLEYQSLLNELKELRVESRSERLPGSPRSIPSTSPLTPELEVATVEPAGEVDRAASEPKKKKRFRI